MKYISKLLILSTLFLGSCDILDKDIDTNLDKDDIFTDDCLLYTSPSPRDTR